jgi:glutaredoxin-like YruB-family protein
MKNVVIYSTPTCTYCQAAKEYFQGKNVEYTEHDVAADEAQRAIMLEKSGQMGVPVITIGDTVIVGFDEPLIEEALGGVEEKIAA